MKKIRIPVLAGAAVALLTAVAVTGCVSPNGSVTITISWPNATTTGKGQTKMMALGLGDVATLDASTMSATFNSSGGIVSDSGVMTVQLLSSGNVGAQNNFGTTRSGNTFTAADVSSVNNWVRPYEGVIDEIDVTIDGIVINEVSGTNSATGSANYNGSSAASATTSWTGGLNHNLR